MLLPRLLLRHAAADFSAVAPAAAAAAAAAAQMIHGGMQNGCAERVQVRAVVVRWLGGCFWSSVCSGVEVVLGLRLLGLRVVLGLGLLGV